MKKTIITVFILTGACVAVWLFFFSKKTDEELIKKQLNGLVAACSKNSDEGGIVMAMKNADISHFIASTCSVSIAQIMMNGTYTPMEFAGSMTRSRSLFTRLKGSVYDVEIIVRPDKKSATLDYSVRVVGQIKKGDLFDDSRDLRSEMKKEDEKWKFASFEIREVLEK